MRTAPSAPSPPREVATRLGVRLGVALLAAGLALACAASPPPPAAARDVAVDARDVAVGAHDVGLVGPGDAPGPPDGDDTPDGVRPPDAPDTPDASHPRDVRRPDGGDAAAGDRDGDGLPDEVERRLGTSPYGADSDGDGIDDATEVGDPDAPLDEDGDGWIDAVESARSDLDGDCLVDQEDPQNEQAADDVPALVPVVCPDVGVCRDAAARRVRCERGVPTCLLDGVPGWEPVEETCDGRDNDCDGRTDETALCRVSDPCRIGRCDGARGCTLEPRPGGCDDGDPCTVDDRCDGGECVPGAARDCDDRDPCTSDVCVSTTGCEHQTVPPVCGERVCGPPQDGCGSCGACPAGRYCLPGGVCSACRGPCGETIPNATAEVCDATREPPRCVATACGEGFVPYTDGECWPAPGRACLPCDTDADCDGGACVELDGALRCAPACVPDAPHRCPAGYSCIAPTRADEPSRCEPWGGVCPCTAATDGMTTGCFVVSAAGVCHGVRRCDAAHGWGACDAPIATEEVCDGVDNDCNGVTDERDAIGCVDYHRDLDGDTWGTAEVRCLCAPAGSYTATRDGDCLDANAAVHPGAREVCGGPDEDCDGDVDPPDAIGCLPFYADRDHDGFGVPPGVCLCAPTPDWSSRHDSDCDDGNDAVHPGARESCATAYDDDCDGAVNEEDAFGCEERFRDEDGDGYGHGAARCLCGPADGHVTLDSGDCDDGDRAVHPGAREVCDGATDEDCDGATDEEDAVGCVPYHLDQDGDGFGRLAHPRCLCGPEGDYRATGAEGYDCNDQIAAIHPGALERCNDYDDNCDGLVDDEEDPHVCGDPWPPDQP